jgi:uncharacterized protein YqgV (UPF0045/DUF77 family)
MLKKTGIENHKALSEFSNNNKWKELLNYEYTVANLVFLKKTLFRKPFFITDNIEIEKSVRMPDASLYYPLSKRDPNLIEVLTNAKKYLKKGEVYSLEKFESIENKKEFENFIFYMLARESSVTIVLFPYHPLVYNGLVENPKYAIIKKVENYLKEFAKRNKIEIKGSYDPAVYGFEGKDFMDGMHALEGVSRAIMKEGREKLQMQ